MRHNDAMTVSEVYKLRKQGRVEEAYSAIRSLYAEDKGPYTSLAMFWVATDVLKKRVTENRLAEAEKIYLALERMLPHVPDKEGWVGEAFRKSQRLMGREPSAQNDADKGANHLLIGEWGEELAACYLREQGYVILERDWHSGHRDIDIIALQNETIVFVEVKTRRNRNFADPISAVHYRKQRNLLLAINHYLKYRKLDHPFRFDVITVVGTLGCENPEIEHIKDFTLPCCFRR